MNSAHPIWIVILSLLLPVQGLYSQERNAQVTGRVTDAYQQPLPKVHVVIKDTDRGTQTDAQGKYTLSANPGDILIFSHIGMQLMKVRVERESSVINVEMKAASIELAEVEIEAIKRRKTQKELLEEYPENKNLIKTSWGIIDKDYSSSAVRIIDGKDLVPVGTDFLNSLQDHSPQMKIERGDEVKVYLRQLTLALTDDPPAALFDVDGFIQGTPTYLSASDIERVAILDRNAAISKYGPQGVGGVIVINTKAQTWMEDMMVDRMYDNRDLVDSLIKEVNHLDQYRPYEPSYMRKLQKAKTEKQALVIFSRQQKRHLNDPYYFLEVYDYYLSRWGNNERSKELLQYVIDSFSNDILVLKALAYLQQQYGNHESALSLYQEILKLHYEKAQSHRDVAIAYDEVGEYRKAFMSYSHYIKILDQVPNTPFDANGEDRLITTEILNLLERNKEVFSIYNDIVSTMDHSDTLTRLVFEWNNQEAEFELEFVNPDGYYDTWRNIPGHDMSQNSEAVQRYSSKQFFIEKEIQGKWQINLDYLGNRSKMPTYLKVSVYHDYGLASQHIAIEVYKLSDTYEKVQLFVL